MSLFSIPISFAMALAIFCLHARAETHQPVLPGNFSEISQCYYQRVNDVTRNGFKLRKMDAIAQNALFNAQSGDVKLSNGSTMDRSCFNSSKPEQSLALKNKIERAMNEIKTRAQACSDRFGIREALETKDILDQTVFLCGTAPKKHIATAIKGVEINREKHIPWTGIHWKKTTHYSPSKAAPLFGYIIILNQDMSSDISQAQESLNGFIFHESLHMIAANNRSWHNDIENHTPWVCDRNPFKDFIYLLQAVCFPDSELGRLLYAKPNGGLSCPNVCESALSEVDPGEINESKKFRGPATTLNPYSKEEAKTICDVIRTTGPNWAKSEP